MKVSRQITDRTYPRLCRARDCSSLEIDPVDFLDRDEFAKIDAAIRFGFERFELGVLDPYYWPLMTS